MGGSRTSQLGAIRTSRRESSGSPWENVLSTKTQDGENKGEEGIEGEDSWKRTQYKTRKDKREEKNKW
jgi:hypothetical protein